MPKNILLTGTPGIGKTTAIQKIAAQLNAYHPSGFYTEEIREDGRRKGFRIITLDGKQAVLSHVDITSRYRVGRYGVNLEGFEHTALPAMDVALPAKLFIIDEIGKMECFSQRFIAHMQKLLDSEKIVVATIAKRGGGFIANVKRRDDVQMIEMSMHNRDAIPAQLIQAVDNWLHL
jgi:nucleoside-triphosphatase